MSRPQIPQFVIACWRRLRQAVALLADWMPRHNASQPPRAAAPAEPEDSRGDPRVHFWAEFRAGQREAEARIAGRRP